MSTNPAALTAWRESAPYWEKYRESIRRMFAPVTEALIQDAGVKPGDSVLDIATGPGEPALSVARVTGVEGAVVGIDPIPEMVMAAQRAAERERVQNAEFVAALADDLPCRDERFNAVVSRFGAMFFASPSGAIREMLRVLRPGGALALAVWHFEHRNPYFGVLSNVVKRYASAPPASPDVNDAFRFATPGHLASIISEVGAVVDVAERLLQFDVCTEMTPEEFYTLRTEMSEKLRKQIRDLSKERAESMRRECLGAFAEYDSGSGVRLPAEVLIVRGRRKP